MRGAYLLYLLCNIYRRDLAVTVNRTASQCTGCTANDGSYGLVTASSHFVTEQTAGNGSDYGAARAAVTFTIATTVIIAPITTIPAIITITPIIVTAPIIPAIITNLLVVAAIISVIIATTCFGRCRE